MQRAKHRAYKDHTAMTSNQTEQEYGEFVFVFLGVERNREPVLGANEQGAGRVFVYRALPGHIVSWGSTREEAVARLRHAVEFAMAGSESPAEWYSEAMAGLSNADHEQQAKVLSQLWVGKGVKWKEVQFNLQTHRPLRAVCFETDPVLQAMPSGGASGVDACAIS